MTGNKEESKETKKEPMKYQGSLTYEEKKARQKKVDCFFKFIYFNWGDERKGTDINIHSGAKEWQIYKEVHDYKNADEAGRAL